MVALTEALALSRARAESMTDVKSLNLWGNGLTEVSILSQAVNVEILSLSVNKISSLSAFRHCRKLRELYLRKNCIASLKELVHLIKSPAGNGVGGAVSDTLQVLWLCDNPCAMEKDYRGKVIALMPALTKLDNQDVSKKERADAMKRELGTSLLDEILEDIEAQQRQVRAKDETNTAGKVQDEEGEQRRGDNASSAPQSDASGAPAAVVDVRPDTDERMEQNADVAVGADCSSVEMDAAKMAVSRPQTSSNTLYAVMALVADLDLESLRIVQSEIDHRVEEALGNPHHPHPH